MLSFVPETVRNRRRKSLAFALSGLVHAIPLVWGMISLSPDLDLGEIDFEFADVEMVDPETLQGDEPEPEPEPEASYPPPGAELPPEGDTAGAEEEPEPEPEPEKKFGDTKSHVDGLGPTTSTLTAFMVNKRVRKLPYAEQGMELIAPLPDFRYLIQGGGFNTLRDFDYIVIATPNPRDITQTFLAVEHRLGIDEVKAGVERAVANANETIEWEEKDGLVMGNPRPTDPEAFDDPRWFVLLDEHRAVYVREEFLPSILKEPVEGKKTTGNFVANLTHMRRFANREPRAAFQLVVKDLHAQLKTARFWCAVPNSAELMAEAAANPELLVRASFLSPADAKTCLDFWQDKLGKIIDDTLWLKLAAGWIYNSFEIAQDGRDLTLRARFEADQAEEILKLLADLSRKMFRASKEEMEAARKEREEAWKRREGGKLPPSAAFAPEEDATRAGDAAGGSAPDPGTGANPAEKPEVTQPTPDEPKESPSPAPEPAKPDAAPAEPPQQPAG